jgi:acyl carrier protein
MSDRLPRSSRDRLVGLVEQILAGNSVSQSISIDDEFTKIGLSSIDMVALMLAVEAEFDIMIPQSDITLENFRSILAIETLLTRMDFR